MRLCFSHSLIPQRFDLLITQYILYCYNILFTVRTSPMCEWERGLSCHRMAHCVLIRCYLQPSLSEAPRCRTFFSTGTDCTSPMCEWGGAILSPHGALRAYTVFLTAEPLRGSPMAHLLQFCRAILSPHGALRAYTVFLTAEPLRGSPIAHLIQSRYGPHISDVRVGKGAILSPHGALRAYTVLLTAEPLRGSPMVLLLQYRTLSDSSDRSDRSDSSFKPITSSYCHSL